MSPDFVTDLLKSLDSFSIPVTPEDSTPPSTSTVAKDDHLVQLLGSQRLKNASLKEADSFGGDVLDYPKFISKFKTDVMDVKGVNDAERFGALQDRTRGEARNVVDTYVYLTDKSEALKKALESLKFYYGTKKGSAQSRLTKVTEGKEVGPNSVDDVKALLQDLD